MSLEQLQSVHQVRRILKAAFPEFRIIAVDSLGAGFCCLDLKKKTIEISEETPEPQAIAALLFNVGHLHVMKNHRKWRLFYGSKEIFNWKNRESKLVKKMSRLGVLTDRAACEWAIEAYLAGWTIADDLADSLVGRYSWNYNAWLHFFSDEA